MFLQCSHNFIFPSYQQPLTSSGTFIPVPKCHKEGSEDLQQPSSLLPSHMLGGSVSATSCCPVPFPVKGMVTAMSPLCCGHKSLPCAELSSGSIYSLLHYNLSKCCQEMLPCSHFSHITMMWCNMGLNHDLVEETEGKTAVTEGTNDSSNLC